MGLKTEKGLRLAKLNRRIVDLVGLDQYALWSFDQEDCLEGLRQSFGAKFGRELSDKEFVALVRGKLKKLFGEPSKMKNKHTDCSFAYEIVAQINKQKVYFQISDREAEQISIFWEFSSSSHDVIKLVKNQFFAMLERTEPADYYVEFSTDDDVLVSYGVSSGSPWSDIEIPLKLQKRFFQSRMKNIQQKHYRMESYLSTALSKVASDKLGFYGELTIS